MGIVSGLRPTSATWRLRMGAGSRKPLCEGGRSSYLSKMHLVKNHFVGMPNAPEPSNESQ